MSTNITSLIRKLSQPLIGPNATKAELLISWSGALLAFFTMLVYGYTLGWNMLQILVSSIFAFDIFGGVIVNSTTSGREYWHNADKTTFKQLSFLCLHLHPFVVAFIWPEYLFIEAFLLYLLVVLCSLTVMVTPKGLQRPVSLGLASMAIGLAIVFLQMPIGLMWLPPLYLIKLIAAHSVSE